MKHRFIPVGLTTAALLFAANLSLADTKPVEAVPAASKAEPAAKSTPASKAEIAARRQAAAKIKPVDINSASRAELKKLPGITDKEAARIIAGRPYGSKAWLVTNNIIEAGTYEAISHLIEARQPYKDGKQNAALYEKKK